jgi:uncharacterized membrane protein YeaQ/YmgE (transglycosylase-associated protein family)
MLHIIWSIIVGFIIGFIAKHLIGGEPLGFWLTSLLGIAGSIVGGLDRGRASRAAFFEASAGCAVSPGGLYPVDHRGRADSVPLREVHSQAVAGA